jgi:hypothetical protein
MPSYNQHWQWKALDKKHFKQSHGLSPSEVLIAHRQRPWPVSPGFSPIAIHRYFRQTVALVKADRFAAFDQSTHDRDILAKR